MNKKKIKQNIDKYISSTFDTYLLNNMKHSADMLSSVFDDYELLEIHNQLKKYSSKWWELIKFEVPPHHLQVYITSAKSLNPWYTFESELSFILKLAYKDLFNEFLSFDIKDTAFDELLSFLKKSNIWAKTRCVFISLIDVIMDLSLSFIKKYIDNAKWHRSKKINYLLEKVYNLRHVLDPEVVNTIVVNLYKSKKE